MIVPLLHALNPEHADASYRQDNITIDQVYTQLDVAHGIQDEDGKISVDRVPLFEVMSELPKMVLLGDPGSGKSTVVRFLALCMCGYCEAEVNGNQQEKDNWKTQLAKHGWSDFIYIPLLVEWRDFAFKLPDDIENGHSGLLLDYLKRDAHKRGIEPETLRTVLESGRALLLLDGLDEVPPTRRELLRDIVHEFLRTWHPLNRYLVTCRILSYQQKEYQIPALAQRTIYPLTEEQITHFIRAWYIALHVANKIERVDAEARTEDLLRTISRPDLSTMAENPMLLTVIAWVHNVDGRLPDARVLVYDRCVELLLFRWAKCRSR